MNLYLFWTQVILVIIRFKNLKITQHSLSYTLLCVPFSSYIEFHYPVMPSVTVFLQFLQTIIRLACSSNSKILITADLVTKLQRGYDCNGAIPFNNVNNSWNNNISFYLRDIWWSKLHSIFKCCSFFQHNCELDICGSLRQLFSCIAL